jgi:glucose-6-phosphate 1-dehydrogenase
MSWLAALLLAFACVSLALDGGAPSPAPDDDDDDIDTTDAFVLIGATGDNALRPNGIWAGLYEAFANGVVDFSNFGIHAAVVNTTSEVMKTRIEKVLTHLYNRLRHTEGWECPKVDVDECTPSFFLRQLAFHSWASDDADEHCRSIASSLDRYVRVNVYLNIPPVTHIYWTRASVKHWGMANRHRVHIAVEKPFGTSLETGRVLHQQFLASGLPAANLHLVDHFLSFFMVRHLPSFRQLAERYTGMDLTKNTVRQIVVTQHEEIGLEGRGSSFSGVGQVRDMVQSHLLQVLATFLMNPFAVNRTDAKLQVLENIDVESCTLGQYDGFLSEPGITYHTGSADATLCWVNLKVKTAEWQGVEVVIASGKAMRKKQYTIEVYQRGGPGILTIAYGKEEANQASMGVKNWPLVGGEQQDSWPVPIPGFSDTSTMRNSPIVSEDGNGLIVVYEYDVSQKPIYVPTVYAVLLSKLLKRDYSTAFVTYPECESMWQIVAAKSPKVCLNPPPEDVLVYWTGPKCSEEVCQRTTPENEMQTVKDVYTSDFSCNEEHNKKYSNVSFYDSKCRTEASLGLDLKSLLEEAGPMGSVALGFVGILCITFMLSSKGAAGASSKGDKAGKSD